MQIGYEAFLCFALASLCMLVCRADPLTKPYIAFLTSPFDQQHEQPGESNGLRERTYVTKNLQWSLDDDMNLHPLKELKVLEDNGSSKCSEMDVHYTIRHSTPSYELANMEILSPPTIYPMRPSSPGKSIFFLRHEEILDAVHFHSGGNDDFDLHHHHHGPSAFPILFQGSTFVNSSPLILDVNQDGFEDIVVVDYDGMITMMELQGHYDQESNEYRPRQKRFMREIQIPRLIMRKDWVANTLNSTKMEEILRADLNPYDSYFEYLSEWSGTMRFRHGSEQSVPGSEHMMFRGDSADVLYQSHDIVDILSKRKNSRQVSDTATSVILEEDNAQEEGMGAVAEDSMTPQRRLQETEVDESTANDKSASKIEEMSQQEENSSQQQQMHDPFVEEHNSRYYHPQNVNGEEGEDFRDYYLYEDDFYGSMDDKLSSEHAHLRHFHQDENYLHIPPHVLSTPTYFECLKHDSKNPDKKSVYEEYLAIAVSYYFDEDEYGAATARHKRFMNDWGGDDTEAKRGQFVASALMIMDLQDHYKGSQMIHLDLSTDNSAPLPPERELIGESGKLTWHHNDYDGMGAFALASPVAADLDLDGKMEVIVVTSMGFIHCIQVPNRIGNNDRRFTVQMKNRIEHPVVVQDVIGDASLEVLALDANCNVICIDHSGETIWHRVLLETKPRITSDLVLGDINGDGEIEVLFTTLTDSKLIIHALVAKTGKDLDGFPKEIITNAPQKTMILPSPIMHLGTVNGTQIVQPVHEELFVIDSSSNCMQIIQVGTELSSVQIADINGNGAMDLLATSTSGEIIVVETTTTLSLVGQSFLKGISVSEKSKKRRNVFGISIPITFTIFDKVLTKDSEAGQKYDVEMRVNRSSKNIVFQKQYDGVGTYTEKILFPFLPGYYILTLRLRGNDGIIHDDEIYFAFNVNSPSLAMAGWMVLTPLVIVSFALLFANKRKNTGESSSGLLDTST